MLSPKGEKYAEVCDEDELNGKPFPTLWGREGGFGFWIDRAGNRGATKEYTGLSAL